MAVVGVVLAGIWLLGGERAAEPVAAAAPSRPAVPVAPEPPLAAVPAAESVPATTAGSTAADRDREIPLGVSREQWAAVEAELGARPDGPAELGRMRAYLEWADTLRRFREARQAGAAEADVAALAQTLQAGLGERIRNAEVTAAEARQIEGAVLALSVPDEAERGERLRQWAAAELAPAAAADPRQAAFERRQVEIVAAWSALPAAARDRAALERELDALRQQSYAPAGTR
ncbi:MAG: hypothetical protein K8R60_06500 [Burkholderiales bacterium]|nr:hypothetical protein [Burkholderiales bacterium]